MRATTDVSALEQEIIATTLARVAILRPVVAMLLAEVLAADDVQLAVRSPKLMLPARNSPVACWRG